ncbi:MAG: hypothetical protein JSR75_07845 [Proteobacteria bacterium]|nr:hypothetical protein [Pseudomonadota bacterium]
MHQPSHSPRVASSALVACLLAACAAPAATAPPAATAAAAEPAPHHAVKPPALPPPTELEQQHGLQVAQLALTASGGLVDVRFKVLDAAKVKSLLGDAAHPPMLIAGDKPPLMPPHHALKGARFAPGQVFYILYPNLRGAVQPGGEVTVAIGDVRLGPVKVQ